MKNRKKRGKYPVNPLYPALKRLPFSGFQSSLIADRRGSAIRPAVETPQKANRSCGRVLMATPKHNGLKPITGCFFWKRFALTLVVFWLLQNRIPRLRSAAKENGEGPGLQKPQKTRGESMLEKEAPCNRFTIKQPLPQRGFVSYIDTGPWGTGRGIGI